MQKENVSPSTQESYDRVAAEYAEQYLHEFDHKPFDRELPDHSLAGIAAFYSLIHIPRREVSSVVRAWRRTVQPGGLMLAAFHKGDETVHRDDWWDKPVSLDFNLYDPKEMEIYLRAGGFL